MVPALRILAFSALFLFPTIASAQMEITTLTLPPARAGSIYSVQLEQTGGTSPTWAVVSGTPGPGLALSSAGLLSGVPSSDGTFAFRVEASEPGSTSAYQDLVLTVTPAGGLAVTTLGLPQGKVGAPYAASIDAEGGAPPYAFQVVSGAPAWFFLDSAGNVTGTPDQVGVFDVELSVFDSAGSFAGTILRLEIVDPQPLMITTAEIPNAVVGVPYSVQLTASGGAPPYGWAIVRGALPDGLSFSSTGQLSGTASAPLATELTFALTDSAAAQVALTLPFEAAPLTELAIVDLPRSLFVPLETEVDQPVNAQGGVPPYAWAIVSGILPPGLVLTPEVSGARIQGVTSSTIAYTVTFEVLDALGQTANAETIIQATADGEAPPQVRTSRRKRDEGGCVCVAATPPGAGFWGLWASVLALGLYPAVRRRKPTLWTT